MGLDLVNYEKMEHKYKIFRMLDRVRSLLGEGAYEKWRINIKFVVCSREEEARY